MWFLCSLRKRHDVCNKLHSYGIIVTGILVFLIVNSKCFGDRQEANTLPANGKSDNTNTTGLNIFEPVGCFRDKRKPRALPLLIRSFAKLVNWTDMNNSLTAVVRACAQKVSDDYGFQYFAVQSYYECWSGENGSKTYNRHGKSNKCATEYGVGQAWANFVYRFVGDGGWSEWSPWNVCNRTCGKEIQTRARTCTNPPPKWDGLYCPGTNISSRECDTPRCPVDGGWSEWSPWNVCNRTCDEENRTRARTCTNPPPKWNGLYCPGTNISSRGCDTHRCPGLNVTQFQGKTSKSTLQLIGLSLGGSLVGLACLIGGACLGFKYLKRRRSDSDLSEPWEIIFDDISLCGIIGEGQFGKVYKAKLLKQLDVSNKNQSPTMWKKSSSKPSETCCLVAVKMLRNGASDDEKQEFLEEIRLMKQIGYHLNIVNMMACCTATVPMFLVVEFAKYGDLLQYLRKRREQLKEVVQQMGDTALCYTRYGAVEMIKESNLYDSPNTDRCAVLSYQNLQSKTESEEVPITKADDDDTLTPADLLTFAWQIARGMEFLSRRGFVHRDLAARNILVCEGKLAKVADFGLSRYVYTEKVYHGQKARKLPIKWMSPEAIYDQVFTTKSDVWAYGILLWEMATIGGTPYPTIGNQRLLKVLNSGYRMEKPEICSDEMYQLMRMCWDDKPAERPSFTLILKKLEEMMLRHSPYLDLGDANFRDVPCCDVSESDDDLDEEPQNTAF